MRELWSSLKFWITDTYASRGHAINAPDSLARTIKDASHVRGGAAGGGGGLSRAASEEVLKHAAEGHENYQKSFEKYS
jgi:hypothetical protein